MVGDLMKVEGETRQELYLVGSLEMQHTDSLPIPYRSGQTQIDTSILMDQQCLIMDQGVIDNHTMAITTDHTLAKIMDHAPALTMNHALATPQCHRLYRLLHSMYLMLLPLLCRMVITNHTLHQWCIVLINTNQILFQEVTIKSLDHNIMKEITIMLTVEIQGIPQETIRILIFQIHKVHFPVKVNTMLVAAAKTSNHLEVLPSGLLQVTLVGNTVNIRPIIILY
jgi:hypothetical protein